MGNDWAHGGTHSSFNTTVPGLEVPELFTIPSCQESFSLDTWPPVTDKISQPALKLEVVQDY